jgi:hypothetical protein
MISSFRVHKTSCWLLGMAIAGLVGCAKAPPPETVSPNGSATQNRLTTIGWLYTLHVDLHGKPPTNYADFNRFAEKLSPANGGPSALPEPFLISPTDGKPIVIRYGIKFPPDPNRSKTAGLPADGPIVAHEEVGANGRRFVVFAGSSRVEQLDEEQFREKVK